MELRFNQQDIEDLTEIIADKVMEKIGKMPTMMLLTIDELASTLKVPKSWIYGRTRDRSNSGIPHIKIGRYIRFNLADVMAWLRHSNDNQ